MDLWIRSQNKKKLVKVCYIGIDRGPYERDKKYYIKHSNGDGDYYRLGAYKTEERALEVLDEIEKLMFSEKNYNGNYQTVDLAIKGVIASNMYKAYQMPED